MKTKRTIRELRESLGWSQRKLANLMDVTVGTVQGWENNRTEPRLPQQRKILDAFGVTWEEVEWPEKGRKLTPAA
jgi:transcriptional regulator with XRE-family HTH domain